MAMKSIHTEIIIHTSAEKVWNILTDFEKFPEWNPFILSLEGKPNVGERLKATLKNGKGTSVFLPKVLVVDPNKTFEWLGSLPVPGLFNGQHHFRIESIGENQVRFVQGEQFSGLLAGMLMKMIGEETIKGFASMNQALKERAEK